MTFTSFIVCEQSLFSSDFVRGVHARASVERRSAFSHAREKTGTSRGPTLSFSRFNVLFCFYVFADP